VLSNYIRTTLAAVVCSGALIAAQSTAQAQQPETQPPQPTQSKATSLQPTTTVTGCVYREEDVPGRAPNVAERAGISEDYILAEVAPSQQPGTAPPATPGATGTSGTTPAKIAMYKLESVDDDRLKALVGKRVEVIGRVDAEPSDVTGVAPTTPPVTKTDKVIGQDRINLPEFEVTSIREVTGTCPAKPSSR
jgi:hypothetical protein